MNLRIAVFGSSSFTGRHLIPFFRNSEVSVEAYGQTDLPYLQYESGRLKDEFLFPSGIDSAFFLSQSPYYRTPEKYLSHLLSVNALSAIMLAEKAKAAGVRRFIYFSSGSVYKPSYNSISESSEIMRDQWYLYSKIAAEEGLRILEDQTFSIHVVRPFALFGPHQKNMLIPNLVTAIQEDRQIFLEAGETSGGMKLTLSYLPDLLPALLQLGILGGPPTMNLASDQAASIQEIAEHIGRRLHRSPKFSHSSNRRLGNFVADNSLIRESNAGIKFTPWAMALDKTIGLC